MSVSCALLSDSLPVYVITRLSRLSSTCLYPSLCLPVPPSVSLASILCVPDNLSFCLLSLAMAGSLCMSLSLCHSVRQPVSLPMHSPLIYYLCRPAPAFFFFFFCLCFSLTSLPLNPHRLHFLSPLLCLLPSVFTSALGTEMLVHVSEVLP